MTLAVYKLRRTLSIVGSRSIRDQNWPISSRAKQTFVVFPIFCLAKKTSSIPEINVEVNKKCESVMNLALYIPQ